MHHPHQDEKSGAHDNNFHCKLGCTKKGGTSYWSTALIG